MIKDNSETKADLTCEECGEPIRQNQIDNKPIYCEFCGAQYSSVETQHTEQSQLEQEKIRFSYTTEELSQELRNLAYQKIYELLKANFSIMKRLKRQEELKQSHILKLAKKLRRALLSFSLPSNRAELLTKTSKKKIENYFEDFQSSLKKKKKNQSNYLPYLIENIKFIYNLINGDYEFSTLAKYNQKAVKKLKIKYGFKINPKNKNSFSYSLSVLLCRKIYRIITAQGHVLDLKQRKNELTKNYTLNTAKDITALILNNEFKGNFSKTYRRLKNDLEIDWVYRESFIEHICSLINLVYKLASNNGYSSRIRGFKKLIAEDLKESRFFEDDTAFSAYFKVNLTLILSRIIHYLLDSSQKLTPLQSDPRKLNYTDNLRVATEILDEILADKKIKSEFLEEFYNLSLDEFQKEYENLQAKLQSDMLYKENFLSFLQKLINSVYKITHTRSKKSKHSEIELVIIKDLANYNFNWESNEKDKSCFYLEKKEIEDSTKKEAYNDQKENKYLQELSQLAEERNIQLLTTEYVNNLSDLEFRCNKCQRTWKDYRANIVQKVERDTFNCPHCNKKTKEELYKQFQKLAQKRGGKLLSTEFYGMTKDHKWKCDICGCEWIAKPCNIKDYPSKKGTWCPNCGYESMKKNLLKYTVKDMQKLANSKPGGGEFLSKKFLGVTKYHKWRCGTCGNVWDATPHEIIGKPSRPDGSWCPNCAKGRAERICRAFFEELFGVPFKTETNLKWLKKYGLHLDGYNRELKIAFERHGIQHYKYQSFFHRSNPKEFEKRLAIDEYKRIMCKKHRITLIEVGYEWRNDKLYKITIDEMEDYIRKKCEEKGILLPKTDKKINWRKFKLNEPDKVKELQELAESRNGKLVSTHYFGELIKLKWYCNKHHYSWYATPNDIRGKPSKPNGTWCPQCAIERHSKLMKKKAKQRSRDKYGKFC